MDKRPISANIVSMLFDHIEAIKEMIDKSWVSVDIVDKMAMVDPLLHLKLLDLKSADYKLYMGFCIELRLYINYELSLKRGDLQRLVEEGKVKAEDVDWDKFKNMESGNPLVVIVAAPDGKPLAAVRQEGEDISLMEDVSFLTQNNEEDEDGE